MRHYALDLLPANNGVHAHACDCKRVGCAGPNALHLGCPVDVVPSLHEFSTVIMRRLSMPVELTVDALVGYASTWSAYSLFRKQHPDMPDPLLEYKARLSMALEEQVRQALQDRMKHSTMTTCTGHASAAWYCRLAAHSHGSKCCWCAVQLAAQLPTCTDPEPQLLLVLQVLDTSALLLLSKTTPFEGLKRQFHAM